LIRTNPAALEQRWRLKTALALQVTGKRLALWGGREGREEEVGENRRKPERESPLIGWNASFFIFDARDVLDVVLMADSRVIFFIYGH
jgi:hypothetical protein